MASWSIDPSTNVAARAPKEPEPRRDVGPSYMLGQFLGAVLDVDPFEDEDEDVEDVDVDFAVGLDVAACAIAVPPPTRAPEMASAISALLSLCRMSLTSFRMRWCPSAHSQREPAGRPEGKAWERPGNTRERAGSAGPRSSSAIALCGR